MSTSVKMSKRGKNLLDQLQAEILLVTGEKISQRKLLDTIVQISTEQIEEIVNRIAEVHLPLSEKERKEMMEVPTDWGVKTREEEIDAYLYGSKGRNQS